MSLLESKCAEPKNKRPGVTTSFCVYDKGHEGNHSWEDTAEKRAERLSPKGKA